MAVDLSIAGALVKFQPSISRAVGLLKNAGYVLMDPTGYLTLTDSGRAIAEKIYERHNTLSRFFMAIGVDEKTALEDACKVEHYISDATFERIKAFAQDRT